jgi:hypothetical protein
MDTNTNDFQPLYAQSDTTTHGGSQEQLHTFQLHIYLRAKYFQKQDGDYDDNKKR